MTIPDPPRDMDHQNRDLGDANDIRSLTGPEENPDDTCDHIELVRSLERGLKPASSRHGEVGLGAAWTERRVAGRHRVTEMLH